MEPVNVWSQLPDALFWTHILPRCDVETRVAFKKRAPRIALPPLPAGFKTEMERYFAFRRDWPPTAGWHSFGYDIPCWKYGMGYNFSDARCLRNAEPPEAWRPLVYLYVVHDWCGSSYDEHRNEMVFWDQANGTVRVNVERRDPKVVTQVARFFIGA